ncbi:MAG: helix-turn-helix domain-containing protein [Candidatus Howiella sp.]
MNYLKTRYDIVYLNILTKLVLSYDRLWKLLIDKKMTKTQMRIASGISSSALAKMGKNEPVSVSVLLSVCQTLDCNFADIIDAVPLCADPDVNRNE